MRASVIAFLLGLVIVAATAGRSSYRNERSAEERKSGHDHRAYKPDRFKSKKGKKDFASENHEELAVNEFEKISKYSRDGRGPSYETSSGSKAKTTEDSYPRDSSRKQKHEKAYYSKEGETTESPEQSYFSKDRLPSESTEKAYYSDEIESSERLLHKTSESANRQKRSPGSFQYQYGVLSNPELILETIGGVPLSADHPESRGSLEPSEPTRKGKGSFPVVVLPVSDVGQILEQLTAWSSARKAAAQRQSRADSQRETTDYTTTNPATDGLEEVEEMFTTTNPISGGLEEGEEIFRVKDVDTPEELERVLEMYREYMRTQ